MGREGQGDKPPAQEASKDLTFKAGSIPEDFTLRTFFFFFLSQKNLFLWTWRNLSGSRNRLCQPRACAGAQGARLVGGRPGPRPYLYPQPWAGRVCCPLTGAGGSGLTLLDVRKLVGGN